MPKSEGGHKIESMSPLGSGIHVCQQHLPQDPCLECEELPRGFTQGKFQWKTIYIYHFGLKVVLLWKLLSLLNNKNFHEETLLSLLSIY